MNVIETANAIFAPTPNYEPDLGYGYSPLLQCSLIKVAITDEGKVVQFMIPSDESDNMDGAIKLAKSLSEAVDTVIVFAGETPDIIYRKKGGARERWVIQS